MDKEKFLKYVETMQKSLEDRQTLELVSSEYVALTMETLENIVLDIEEGHFDV